MSLVAKDIQNFRRHLVGLSLTSDTTLTVLQLDMLVSNTGATATVTATLPVATVGMGLTASRQAAHAFRLKPATGGFILGGAVNDYLEMISAGEVVLYCHAAGTWTVVSGSANWWLQNGYGSISDATGVVYATTFGVKTDGTNSSAELQAAHDAAFLFVPKRPVILPVGPVRLDTTVNCKVPMRGSGGSTTREIETILFPGMSDGSPVLQYVAGSQYKDLRDFTIGRFNGSTVSVAQNCTGIKAGTFGGDPSFLGLATAVPVLYLENIRLIGMAVGIEAQGWLSTFKNVQAGLCGIGLKGEYMNSSSLEFRAFECGQAVQMKSSRVHFIELYDEASATNRVAASTFDDCYDTLISYYYSEAAGTTSAIPWIRVGATTLCKNFTITQGVVGAVASGFRIAFDKVEQFNIGLGADGYEAELYSTTANSKHNRIPTLKPRLYTPVWTAATTNPSLVGTSYGSWSRNGTLITATISISPVAGTTYGAGGYFFSLPVVPNALAVRGIGSVHALDSGVVFRVGAARVLDDGTARCQIFFNSTIDAASPTIPHTWKDNDTISITVSYEGI